MPPPPLRFLSPIHKATRRIGIHLQAEMDALDMRNVDGHLLSYLGSYAPAAVGDLSRIFGHKPSTLTSILDRLDRKGLVKREMNPEDRRSFLIRLTAKGKRHATRIRALVEGLENEIARRVSKSELAGFNAVMDAIGAVTQVELK